jgi:hypothetical protein
MNLSHSDKRKSRRQSFFSPPFIMGNAAGKEEDFLISDLPEVFGDLERIPQDDGPAAVCQIDYPAAFSMAFDYFRAILRIEEYSWRALRLTTLCLQQNPANYTYVLL